MNIVHVSGGELRIPPDKGGGIEALIFSVSKQLSKLAHNVTILDRKYAKTDPAIECIDGVNIVRLSAWRFPRFNLTISYILNQLTFAFQVQKYLQKTRNYDIIHIHETGAGFVLALINRRLRNKLFYTPYSSRRTKDSPTLWDRITFMPQNRLVKWVAKVTVPNELIGTKLVREAKIKPEKVMVMPYDVDMNTFNPDLDVGDIRQRYELNGKKVVLFVGTINERKGVEYLVKAANIIVNEFGCKDAIFLLVGPTGAFGLKENIQTEYLTRVLGLIESYGLNQNIKLTGPIPVDDLRKLYVACNVFVLPSLADLSPRAIPEAMACGKPVIASKVGGIPALVEDGQSGFLVDPMDERQLAEKIKYFIDNPAKAKKMGAYGRRLAEERFSSGKIAERLLQVYQLDREVV